VQKHPEDILKEVSDVQSFDIDRFRLILEFLPEMANR